jgi:hydrogenase-4 component B
VVIAARNGLLFLVAWEVMSLASFFLVIYEYEKSEVSRAGWTYLVATHLGAVFLLMFFLTLNQHAGSFEFSAFSALQLAPSIAAPLFLFALVGFGAKAGFFPFHVWLPLAHPAAPSHVSALMSGVMIKMGIYGFLRALAWLGPVQPWWAFTVLVVGVVSGVGGILLALGQHDLKRLLAFSSVENIGLIGIGLGLGMLGNALNMPMLAVLGFAGALLHVLNHAIFKGLLFLGAGAVWHVTGSRRTDQLGGLIKSMPVTAATFLVASIAISGLPPLNGFVSEFLLYLASFHSLLGGTPALVAAVLTIASLGLTSGLAAACFTKAFGIVFLGEPRQEGRPEIHDLGMAMRLPMLILAALCLLIGIGAWLIMPLLLAPLRQVSQASFNDLLDIIEQARSATVGITLGACLFFLLVGWLIWARKRLQQRQSIRRAVTWDCGYLQPTSRMQYTASSFSQPIIDFFELFLSPKRQRQPLGSYFPSAAAFRARMTDLSHDYMYAPSFRAVEQLLAKLRWLQSGQVNIYILYIAVTLLVLLAWKLL